MILQVSKKSDEQRTGTNVSVIRIRGDMILQVRENSDELLMKFPLD